jgi:hypothetical protein
MKEIWLPVPDWQDLYEVSNLGRVRSLPRWGTKGGIMTATITEKGYERVILTKAAKAKHVKVHHLVFRAFNPGVPFTEINHKDLNKRNNRADNLEPSNRAHNQKHALMNGRYGFKYSWAIINEIRLRYSKGERQCDLMRQFGVDRRYMKDIVHNRCWKV